MLAILEGPRVLARKLITVAVKSDVSKQTGCATQELALLCCWLEEDATFPGLPEFAQERRAQEGPMQQMTRIVIEAMRFLLSIGLVLSKEVRTGEICSPKAVNPVPLGPS